MLDHFWKKFNAFAAHCQMIFILIVGLCVVCISWSVEKILEVYVVGNTISSYLSIIGVGLFVLWFVQHFIRQVV